MTDTPIFCEFQGNWFVPVNDVWLKRAQDAYHDHEKYFITGRAQRSEESHRHYFAAIEEAWNNLPEAMEEQFPMPEHLRKYALIKTGYRDVRSIVAATEYEAQKIAAFVKPMDEFAAVVVVGNTVHVATAKSQSLKSMGKDVFQASKQDVLDYIAELVGVKADDLEREGET